MSHAIPLMPVLDVVGNHLVRANGGDRAAYQPWTSRLAPHADPCEFVESVSSLFAASGGRELPVGAEQLCAEGTRGSRPPLACYAADLDALQGNEPNWALWSELASRCALWCDVGTTEPAQAQRLAEIVAPRGGRVVIATEAARNRKTLLGVVDAIPAHLAAVSFDWRGDRALSRGDWLRAEDWLDLAAELHQRSVRSFIVLDLKAVGADVGPTVTDRCRRLRQRLPRCELVAGGGVRGAGDLNLLHKAGCNAALVASLLHRCSSPADLDRALELAS